APLDVTFQALLEELQDMPAQNGPMPMKLEPWPGGRWYRDLGNGNGHFWAVVQAIKRPTLLEFSGPLMLSFPVIHNVQYRLAEENGVTVITFHHFAFGSISDEHKEGMRQGWTKINDEARQRAVGAFAR
ncbi:MAG: SRPBCC domain-containing protein, partial [Candidatus Acidiferrales bacterium]